MSSTISYTDGDWSQAQPVSRPRLSQPFPGDAGEYVLEQDFQQDLASFAPLALNTAYAATGPYASYVLVKEGALTNLDGASVRWTRTYAQVPNSRSDGGSIPYQFIGFAFQDVVSGSVTTTRNGRPRYTRCVPCRILHDYFLIGTGGSYTNILQIPTIQEQLYFTPDGNVAYDSTSKTYTFTPFYAVTDPLYAATGCKVDFLNDGGVIQGTTYNIISPSVPTRSQYLLWMQNNTEIVAEASKLTRWMGNIFDRTTVYIIAQ